MRLFHTSSIAKNLRLVKILPSVKSKNKANANKECNITDVTINKNKIPNLVDEDFS